MRIYETFLFCLILFVPQTLWAGYNANMTGVVTHVLTYTSGDQIYFKLDNQPQSHPMCGTDYFSIDASVPAERKARVLSRLLAAHAMGSRVNIGFDSQGDCSHGRIRVHRVG